MHDETKVLLLLTDVDINLLCFLILDICDLKKCDIYLYKIF